MYWILAPCAVCRAAPTRIYAEPFVSPSIATDRLMDRSMPFNPPKPRSAFPPSLPASRAHAPTFLPMTTPTCSVGTYRKSVKWSRRCCVVWWAVCRVSRRDDAGKGRGWAGLGWGKRVFEDAHLVGLDQLGLQSRAGDVWTPVLASSPVAAAAAPPVVAVDPAAADRHGGGGSLLLLALPPAAACCCWRWRDLLSPAASASVFERGAAPCGCCSAFLLCL